MRAQSPASKRQSEVVRPRACGAVTRRLATSYDTPDGGDTPMRMLIFGHFGHILREIWKAKLACG